MAHAVVLFDGVCNLCNRSVQFIIDRDPSAIFHFAALQSTAGQRILEALGSAPHHGDPETVILVEDGVLYERSTAALRIARRLRGPARWLAVLGIVPAPIRDAVYGFVSRNRMRILGKREVCGVPTPERRARFLSESP